MNLHRTSDHFPHLGRSCAFFSFPKVDGSLGETIQDAWSILERKFIDSPTHRKPWLFDRAVKRRDKLGRDRKVNQLAMLLGSELLAQAIGIAGQSPGSCCLGCGISFLLWRSHEGVMKTERLHMTGPVNRMNGLAMDQTCSSKGTQEIEMGYESSER